MRPSVRGAPRPSVTALTPILGMLLAAGLIVSRRPDLLVHPQFWAEDGRYYYGNVYNLGVRQAILLPQSGYFETFPVVVAWIARFASLSDAPLVTGIIGLGVQALPVALVLSPRASTVSADLRVRAVLALIFVLLPYGVELDATAVNSQWYLAVAALLVLMFAPPRRRLWRWADAAILLITGLTGPFAFVLAPLAWWRRWRRGDAFVPWPMAAILTGCAVLQAVSVLLIAPHAGINSEARPNPSLGATPDLFAQLIGGRLILGAIIGEANGLTASIVVQWIALAAGLLVLAAAIRFGRQELHMLIVVAAFVLAGTLLSPSVASPAWPILAAVPPNAERYFLLGDLALLAGLVALAASARPAVVRLLAAALVTAALIFVATGHWSFARLPPAGFSRQASVFEHAKRGTVVTFTLNPPPWSMTLLKR